MRRWSGAVLAGLVVLVFAGGAGAQAPAGGQAPAGQPSVSSATGVRTTWYFYKVRWGHQDEFLNLFQKNHYPVLKAYRDLGRYVSVKAFTPQYHGDGRADWTFAVELVEREGVTGLPPEAELLRKLFPDQATFRREERRRFEILDAHWDVPLQAVDFEAREMVE